MNIVYDLLLNFQEEDVEFFEWKEEDELEHVKKIPLVKVSRPTFLEFLEKNVQVDSTFLEEIYGLTEKFDHEKIDYSCLFTDGFRVIAIEFDKRGKSIFRSSLLLEDETEIVEYAKNDDEYLINYQVLEKLEKRGYFTRYEKKIKKYLEREIISAYNREENSKLEYLYLEYFETKEKDTKKIMETLLDSMRESLTKKHLALYEVLLLLNQKKVS